MDEAARLGVSKAAVHSNIMRGNYVGIRLERINPRVVFVVDAGKLVPKRNQSGNIGKHGLNHKELGHTAYTRLWRIKTAGRKIHNFATAQRKTRPALRPTA